MRRRVGFISLALFLPLLLVALFAHVSNSSSQGPQTSEKLDPALEDRLQAQPDRSLRFIVHLAQQADLAHNLPQNRTDRRSAVVRRLQEVAEGSQRELLGFLDTLHASGEISSFRPLWIVNAIAVEGRPDAVNALARRADVARLTLDARQQFVSPPDLQPQEPLPQDWNIQRVRAPHAWDGLGITGLGVTIAIMDTGVDWSHPDLRENYRGWQRDGTVRHEGNWFDVFGDSSPSPEPFDPNGHGTHVAGTAVGRSGTGVAPDANWIAVRAFDGGGFATTSDLHIAFQWLLAPGGQPDLAPDVVNGSWSGSSQSDVFADDLYALHQAGIVTVFAAGNSGPSAGSIGAPASYGGAVAVAAADYRDEVTWFSSRGPSTLTTDRKPELAAPGARIYSTLPGAAYGNYNGTSMAAPHVSGAAALLLSANPNLDVRAVTRILTETARSAPPQGHDIGRGWGMLDIYAALASQLTVGQIRGTVTSGSSPVPGATISVTTPGGTVLNLVAEDSGAYSAWLRPGTYRLQAGAFGHAPSTPLVVNVQANGTAHQNLSLLQLPHSTISGRVSSSGGNALSDVVITAGESPVSTTTDAQGTYSLELPAGHTYELYARRTGFRLEIATVSVDQDQPLAVDFRMQEAQSILLVDSGRWYYDSYAPYFRQALDDAGYAYDEWHIYAPDDTPSAEKLLEYDVVVWTAPQDAPGWIGGGDALVTYLQDGGNLFISGQYVAQRDGVSPTAHAWFTQYLQGRYLSTATEPFTLTGKSGTPFDGMQIALNTGDGAANQTGPSRVEPRPGALTRPLFSFLGDREGASGALQAGWCRPHRVIFLGFGLEGVGTRSDRSELLQRALAHFAEPPIARALALDPTQTNEVVLPGETLTFTFSLQNLSEVHTTTIDLEYSSEWTTTISQDAVRLGPCQQRPITLTMQVPSALPTGSRQAIELTALADYGAVAGASVVATAPAPILLVADYRWYDKTTVYRNALNELQLAYDVWDTNVRGSPSYERLAAYDTVLWYTGYDWYAPLTAAEIQNLSRYLDDGGRLFLSSQDYLYYHRHDSFSRDFLGILDYQESMTSTVLLGGDNAVVGDGVGPYSLSYEPYRNFSDGLVPAPSSEIHIWDDWGFASGVANSGAGWRSLFWSVPFELLQPQESATMLGSVLGWLGDMGDSTLMVSPRVAPASETRQYTLTLRNWQYAPSNSVTMTAPLPPDLLVDPFSITGGAVYDAASNQLVWQGVLDAGAEHVVAFNAQPAGSVESGSRLQLTATIAFDGQNAPYLLQAKSWTGTPDLAASFLHGHLQDMRPGSILTYTAFLRNTSDISAEELSATLSLPRGLYPITETLSSPSGSLAVEDDRRILWQGGLAANAEVSFTVAVSATGIFEERVLPAGLVIADGDSSPIVRTTHVQVTPYRWLFPLIQR